MHLYVVGKTGTGKSTLLASIARQDLEAGRGFCFIDPHGDVVERIASAATLSGRSDVTYWNVPDPASPYGYNPLRHVREDKISLAVSGVLEAMRKLWIDAWGVRMEHILRNALYALFERPHSTIADVLRLLGEESFRKEVAAGIQNEAVRLFWQKEFSRYSFGYRSDGAAPVQNKIGAFLADPLLNRILTKPREDLHLRAIMDKGGVLLVNLAKGQIGEDSANLLGSLLVSTVGLAAFSRADMPATERRPFFLYLDEFQSFTTLSIATMASELRKYGVGLTLAHQQLDQLEPEVRHAVLGNTGTIIAFRTGAEDAPHLGREFAPVFGANDLIALPNYHIFLKLMIDGVPSRAFSAVTAAVI
ncbi:type IV secretory system conjugative DNA transfer family protein [Reyranella sp.]|uniref:type IV secretory system conjugative DNA transfer family protein n=1 Tax=Reyranella sp. TaxID=1929291 RepID=UPI00271C3178|nr:TraM recognition domain-containing protein [Reyranella sp.]MDO8973953.1 type IV secretion system DNA-binding domain-containing protein [Reyranella sp.]